MEYHQDWFMRQIQMLIAFLIRLTTDKDGQEREIFETGLKDNPLSDTLQQLIDQDEICLAEDILYENADGVNMDAFYAGLLFYLNISQLSEDKLKTCNFSREEITEGILSLCRMYGISEELLTTFGGKV